MSDDMIACLIGGGLVFAFFAIMRVMIFSVDHHMGHWEQYYVCKCLRYGDTCFVSPYCPHCDKEMPRHTVMARARMRFPFGYRFQLRPPKPPTMEAAEQEYAAIRQRIEDDFKQLHSGRRSH